MELDDWSLWSRSRAGDSAAFELLFRRHAKAIYNYCFRRTGSWATAEDLLSVVFLEAWRRRDKELPQGAVLPWLYGIATNVVRNRRRAERRYAAALSRVPAPRPEPDFADESAERLQEENEAKRLLGELARLPGREQDVAVLCGWCGLSYEDAAAALGVPVGTVRSRLSRARLHLREPHEPSGHEQEREPRIDETNEP